MGIKERNAPSQYKQSSRKNKRAWRKNIDLEDIESGLEQTRDEEIKGYISFCIVLIKNIFINLKQWKCRAQAE